MIEENEKVQKLHKKTFLFHIQPKEKKSKILFTFFLFPSKILAINPKRSTDCILLCITNSDEQAIIITLWINPMLSEGNSMNRQLLKPRIICKQCMSHDMKHLIDDFGIITITIIKCFPIIISQLGSTIQTPGAQKMSNKNLT